MYYRGKGLSARAARRQNSLSFFAFGQALTRLCFCTILQTFRRLKTFAVGFKVNLAFDFPIQIANFFSVLELKKNCPPELIIYIVGSKADLHRYRQVTPDLARLSLHNWFPP